MLQRVTWNPDYDAEKRRRLDLLLYLRALPEEKRRQCLNYYARGAEGCIAFIEDWCETFDPRNAGTSKPTRMPFKLFPKQEELVHFLWGCYQADANGLIEKSRDMGATWVCVCFSVWLFLFHDGATVGWGSRKAMLVDKIGDMSSIFEKIRFLLLCIPTFLYPSGFDPSSMMSEMKIREPGNNSITGEAGDDIGRGGRTRVYFKDESSHYVHPESIEAALGDTTRVQIDISSVNGLGNVFHRRREAGLEWSMGQPAVRGRTNVFVMDWSDHPLKTQEWYEQRRSQAIEDGLLHIFEQEVNRNYAASVAGVVVPTEWVQSAIDAHLRLGFEEHENDDNYAGLDVADEGADRNAMSRRKGVVLRYLEEWGARDTGVTARKAVDTVQGLGRVSVQYDCIGVGAGVKAEINRLKEDEDTAPKLKGIGFVPWNAGAGVLNPEARVEPGDSKTPLNKDFYKNLKAQGWWQLRRRFEKTHRAIRKLEGDKDQANFTWDQDELISIDSTLPLLRTLQKELSQPTMGKSTRMQLLINKQPEGTRSPNLADAVVMCYWPVGNDVYDSMDWV